MNPESKRIENVIVTSDEPWSEVWHTQLHYAFQLSKRFRVIFLGPPSPWKVSHLWTFKQNYKSVNNKLEVARYVNLLPAFLGSFALQVNDWLNSFLLRKRLNGVNGFGKLLIWHFDRYRSIRLFSGSPKVRHIYHVIDPVANMNGDLELSARADLIVVTSPKFIEHYNKLNSNVLQQGQGVDLDLYAIQEGKELTKTLISNNSIMLLGTLTDSIDFGLLENLAMKFPYQFCLIGPDKIKQPENREGFKKLLSYQNVHWLGSMPPSEFRLHLFACRVGIIAYNLSGINKNNLRSPLKFISYIACGKCVISNIDCEVPVLEGKAVYYASGRSEMENLIASVYAGDLEFDRESVNEFLKKVNYDSLLESIFLKLNEELPEKISSEN